jgi:hypothetical protein
MATCGVLGLRLSPEMSTSSCLRELLPHMPCQLTANVGTNLVPCEVAVFMKMNASPTFGTRVNCSLII